MDATTEDPHGTRTKILDDCSLCHTLPETGRRKGEGDAPRHNGPCWEGVFGLKPNSNHYGYSRASLTSWHRNVCL